MATAKDEPRSFLRTVSWRLVFWSHLLWEETDPAADCPEKKNILLTAKYEAKKISGSFLRLANLNQNITNKKNFVVLIGLAQ